jgi:hypothetical protein
MKSTVNSIPRMKDFVQREEGFRRGCLEVAEKKLEILR